jgi:hypothetical protein
MPNAPKQNLSSWEDSDMVTEMAREVTFRAKIFTFRSSSQNRRSRFQKLLSQSPFAEDNSSAVIFHLVDERIVYS